LQPASPDAEYRYWYQWYFHTERGRAGLSANRRPFCRKLWELWSPNYRFNDAEYELTAKSFDNSDFVEVAIHSYRHRYGAVKGDPAFNSIEAELARRPAITVPTIVLHGESDGVSPPQSSEPHERFFAGPYHRRVVPVAGHFLPRETPEAVVQAVCELGS
jgi:pimeloyl-ACP methyl ester carboxylesterase